MPSGLWRENADGTLTLANSYTYDTWGKPTTATHNSVSDLGFRFTYVGEFDVQWDDAFGLGLYYMHARHYSPTLGRFLQPDPDGSETNLYAYTANNPVTELDPDGTCFILCAVVNAALDTAIYLATTENATLEGAVGAAAVGAVTGFVGVGLLSKVAKAGGLAVKALSKVPRAGRGLQRAIFNGSRTSQRGQILVPGGRGGGRFERLKPDPDAVGPHTTFRRNADTGAIDHYATWRPQTNPRNPNPWILQRRFDRVGSSHFSKLLRARVRTPHVQGGRTLGGVRPARQWEIPR